MLVASTGGHLAQLHQLRPLLGCDDDVVWVTFDTPQSRSLLAGERVEHVRSVAPRDWRNLARVSAHSRSLLLRYDIDRVISTGSAVALAFLPTARLMGIRAEYIESAARSTGPSVTGRLLQHVPGVHLSAQYDAWAVGRWARTVSVFDAFSPVIDLTRQQPVRRVVVTLGMIPGYGFVRLLERMQAILPPDVEVLWQAGSSAAPGLEQVARTTLPQAEMQRAMEEADVVVAHAGAGSALAALTAGRVPVLVPRRAAFGEHVDDHQQLIARDLSGRGLAVWSEADELSWGDVVRAASSRVVTSAALRVDLAHPLSSSGWVENQASVLRRPCS